MDVEEYAVHAVEELDADTVTKYKMAADIANKTMLQLVALCLPGADIGQLCAFGDQYIADQLAGVFTSGAVEKGQAFPTCISVNNCVENFSPLQGESAELALGDIAKLVLGVQIDGQIAVHGHTHVVGVADKPLCGPGADAICASFVAADVVLRLLRPGTSSDQITAAVGLVAEAFGCTPVKASFTCNMKRFILEGERIVPHFVDLKDDNPPPPFEISENDVFNVDIQFSTGTGETQPREARCTVFQRNLNEQFQLRMKASRQVYAEISKRFPTMPFTVRDLGGPKAILGMKECINHNLLIEYPVTYEKPGRHVAQVKFTALVQRKATTRLTSHPPPYVKSDYQLADKGLLKVLRRSAKVDGPSAAL